MVSVVFRCHLVGLKSELAELQVLGYPRNNISGYGSGERAVYWRHSGQGCVAGQILKFPPPAPSSDCQFLVNWGPITFSECLR